MRFFILHDNEIREIRADEGLIVALSDSDKINIVQMSEDAHFYGAFHDDVDDDRMRWVMDTIKGLHGEELL